jgi:hypothetical protein
MLDSYLYHDSNGLVTVSVNMNPLPTPTRPWRCDSLCGLQNGRKSVHSVFKDQPPAGYDDTYL